MDMKLAIPWYARVSFPGQVKRAQTGNAPPHIGLHLTPVLSIGQVGLIIASSLVGMDSSEGQ